MKAPVEPSRAAILAVTLRGYARAEGDPVQMAGLVARVHQLLADHAQRVAGTVCPSGTDAGLARFADVDAALACARALVAEVESARDPGSHRHHGLLAVGIDVGPVLIGPDGRVLGVAVARAVRLALEGETRGETLISDRARQEARVPEGLGLHTARNDAAQRLGYGFHCVVDYGA